MSAPDSTPPSQSSEVAPEKDTDAAPQHYGRISAICTIGIAVLGAIGAQFIYPWGIGGGLVWLVFVGMVGVSIFDLNSESRSKGLAIATSAALGMLLVVVACVVSAKSAEKNRDAAIGSIMETLGRGEVQAAVIKKDMPDALREEIAEGQKREILDLRLYGLDAPSRYERLMNVQLGIACVNVGNWARPLIVEIGPDPDKSMVERASAPDLFCFEAAQR